MLPSKIKRAVRLTALWVKAYTDDWVIVKEEMMNELSNEERKYFGRRDAKTKETTSLNPLELEIVELWKQLTGVDLKLRSYKERSKLRWWKPPWEE